MEKCFQEAVRYLGYGKNPVDEATSRLVEKGFLELEKVSAHTAYAAERKFVYTNTYFRRIWHGRASDGCIYP